MATVAPVALTVAISAAISLDVATADLLLDHLPSSVRVPSESRGADVLSPVLELLGRETEKDSEGSGFIRMQLSRILFAQVTGWLAALNDDRISAALVLMHREADRSWTVWSLAHSVGMSRSAFAQRFRGNWSGSPRSTICPADRPHDKGPPPNRETGPPS